MLSLQSATSGEAPFYNALVGKVRMEKTKNDDTESVGFCLQADGHFCHNYPAQSDNMSIALCVDGSRFDVWLRLYLDPVDESSPILNPVDDAINRWERPGSEL